NICAIKLRLRHSRSWCCSRSLPRAPSCCDMVSSVDGLAVPLRLVRQVSPQRRDVASEAVTGAWGRAGPRRAAAPASLRPGRDRGGSFHHRPLVVAGGHEAVAVLLGALPRGAEAVLGQLPRAFALCASADRLARHFAVGGERHLEFDVGRRCGEGLTGEEGRLDFVRCKHGGKGGRGDGDDSHAGDEQSAHGGSPWNCVGSTIQQIVANRSNAYSIDGRTRSGGLCPSRKVLMLTITFSPMSMRPSSVAEPICGSSTTLPRRASLTSLGLTAGSCSNTSSPAPAMSPEEISRTSAFSSITSPRAVLTM